MNSTLSLAERSAILNRFADRIESKAKRFAKDISRAVNKPLPLAQDEVVRAVSHIRTAATLPSNGFKATVKIAPGVTVRNEPVGVVALLMPWNNPLAIPAGKIAAAFLGGNGIVLKPSPLDGGIGTLLVAEARAAGLTGLEIVEPADAVGAQLAWHPNIDAIAITGSISSGEELARACTATGKPLQAELGGNNAAIVTADADLSSVVPELVRNAFVYSGQRCTAIRRWVVDESIYDEFVALALDETAKFASDPLVGELINDAAAARAVSAVDSAVAAGATRLTPASTSRKRRVAPVIVRAENPHSDIVQNELFGPVAVIQVSTSLGNAVELANGVKQGLLVGICGSDAKTIEIATRESSVGIVQIGGRPVPVHPDAPFGGWGHSGIGPAEHGVWDMQFYTRPRTVYSLNS
jgi:aldehyde dehydrogenase (NAD+)